jgi:hypothetical protein
LRRQATARATAFLTNIGEPISASAPPASVTLPGGDASTATSSSAEPKPGQKPEEKAEQKPEVKKDEGWWRDRIAAARKALAINEGLAATLQSRVNVLQREAVSLDSPLQQAKAREDLGRALLELERANKQIAEDRKAIAAIQEDARRLDVPAGWIR